MYKVLIVDDDLLARMGMMSLIDWQKYGFEVVGTADSGEQALELMDEHQPDVVFTDVVMHGGMDGVELTRQIKLRYPQVLVVALSCYTDVDYVKNIIRMGAEDYLQKLSMSPQALAEILNVLADKLSKRAHTAIHGANTLLRLLQNKPVLRNDPPVLTEGKPYRMLAVRKALGQTTVARGVDSALDALQRMGLCCARYREDVAAAVLPDAPVEDLETLLSKIALIQPEGNGPLSLGVSPVFSSTDEVRGHFFLAGEASLSCYLFSENRIFFYEQSDSALLKDVSDRIEQINRLLDEGDLDGAATQMPLLTASMKAQSCQAAVCRQMDIALFVKLTRLMMARCPEASLPAVATMESFANVDEAHARFLQQLDAMRSLIAHMPQHYRREVKLAIDYIKEHYSEDVTLSQVAKQVAMSESRLSSVFKKETGKGLINYLEEYRIAQAARLLTESREPMFLIAQRVGYANVNYFSRVFKKVRGESPSQFLKRQKIWKKTKKN
ncbi:MAG: response regulator [Christensenellales bacterium]|jgi:two-component system response regulator YesN